MRDVKLTVIIGRAYTRTSMLLFKPFAPKKWAVLIFIALFAGSLSGGFQGNFPSPPRDRTRTAPATDGATQKAADPAVAATTDAAAVPMTPQTLKRQIADLPPWVLPVVAALVVAGLLIWVLFVWMAAYFKFIWFNAVINNEASVVEPFHRHRAEGSSFFKASLLVHGVFIALLAAIAYAAFQIANSAGVFNAGFEPSFGVLLGIFGVPLMGLIALIVAGLVVVLFIEDFVLPVMALDRVPFMAALSRMGKVAAMNLKDMFVYYIAAFFLSLVTGAVTMVIFLLVLLVFAIAGFLFFGAGYLLLVAALKAKWLLYAFLALTVPPFATALMIAFYAAALPFAVFFRSFSVEYLCSLNSGYDAQTLEAYGQSPRSPERSRRLIWVPVLVVILLGITFIGGLLAAIAVPNFMKAREAAKSAAARSSPPIERGPAGAQSNTGDGIV